MFSYVVVYLITYRFVIFFSLLGYIFAPVILLEVKSEIKQYTIDVLLLPMDISHSKELD